MNPTFRRVAAVVIGLVVAMLVVAGVDAIVGRTWPLPLGTDVKNAESMRAAMAAMPLAALCTMVLGWTVAAAFGAFTAVRKSPAHEARSGYIVTALFFAATIGNLLSLPHPAWMFAAAVICVPLAGLAGTRAAASMLSSRPPLAPVA